MSKKKAERNARARRKGVRIVTHNVRTLALDFLMVSACFQEASMRCDLHTEDVSQVILNFTEAEYTE